LRSMQHFTYKYWSTTQTKRGGNFAIKGATKNPRRLNIFSLLPHPSQRRSRRSPLIRFFFLHFWPLHSRSSSSFPTASHCPHKTAPHLLSFPDLHSSTGHRPTTATNQLPLPQILPLSCSLCSSQLLNLPPSTHLLPTAADHHIRRPAPLLSPIAGSFGLHHRPSQVSSPFSSSSRTQRQPRCLLSVPRRRQKHLSAPVSSSVAEATASNPSPTEQPPAAATIRQPPHRQPAAPT
jgi:hypothetical protein